MGNPSAEPPSIRSRLFIAAVAFAGLGAIGADFVTRVQTPGHRIAAHIADGFARSVDPDGDLISDEKLTHDADEAGYRWAESRSADRPEACQRLRVEFRKGCLDYVSEQDR